MDTEQITIIVPIYNRAKLVGDTLDSIVSQTWRPLHVVLVDNNSSDKSLDVIKRWKRANETQGLRITVLSEPRPGACAARNTGLAVSDTEWTMFFDSDDIMLPDHVERAMTFAAKHPDADILGWPMMLNYASGASVIKDFIPRNIVYNNIMHSSFATLRYMARTSLFKKVGGWREGLTIGDDVELGNRLLAQHPKVYKISNRCTVDVYESEVSVTNSPDKLVAMAKTMKTIADNLPAKHRHWTDLRTIILAAAMTRNPNDADKVVMSVMARTPLPRRWLWQFFYRWTLAGGRGAARIYELIKWTGI